MTSSLEIFVIHSLKQLSFHYKFGSKFQIAILKVFHGEQTINSAFPIPWLRQLTLDRKLALLKHTVVYHHQQIPKFLAEFANHEGIKVMIDQLNKSDSQFPAKCCWTVRPDSVSVDTHAKHSSTC